MSKAVYQIQHVLDQLKESRELNIYSALKYIWYNRKYLVSLVLRSRRGKTINFKTSFLGKQKVL